MYGGMPVWEWTDPIGVLKKVEVHTEGPIFGRIMGMKQKPRSWSLPLGRVLGFPIDAHFSLVVFLGLLLFLGGDSFGLAGLLLASLTLASVVAHELGHSVVARRLGVPILGISLYPFGGMAKMAGMPRGPRDELWIAVAGPAVSLALAGAFGLASQLAVGTLQPVFGFLMRINAMLGLFNLIPALPMDGGRVYRAWSATRHGFLGGTLRATRLSRVLAWGMILLGVFSSPWLVVIGGFVLFVGRREELMARMGVGYRGPDIVWTASGLPSQGYRIERDLDGKVLLTVEPDSAP